MPDQNSKRNTDFLDVLRWMATFAVVLYHVLNALQGSINLSESKTLVYNLAAVPMRWHVPTFLMISGALFLNPEKQITYAALFRKYIRRILLALIIFGYPMALIELYFTTHTITAGMFLQGLQNLIAGKTWSHMWYLYMLVGLYLLLPSLRSIIGNESKRNKLYLLIILFVFTSVLKTISDFGIAKIGFTLPVSSVYLFYFLMGYYCLYEIEVSPKMRTLSILGIVCSLLIVFVNAFCKLDLPLDAESPVIVVLTVSLFLLARSIPLRSILLTKTRHLCFGVYLVHVFFLHVLYKVVGISPFDYPVFLSIPVIAIIVFALSILVSAVLNKIPPLRKYVM